MKKILSIAMTVLMLVSVLSVFAVPASAEGETTTEPTENVLVMYVSDGGNDTNDGLTAEMPKKTINNAVDYMKNNVGGTGLYTRAELVLVGDVTISKSTITSDHPLFALTIRSADKDNARLLLGNNFRIGGETLFTNIKVLITTTTAGKALIANGSKLTMGLPGVANDVVTYDAATSKYALNISGGFPSWTVEAENIDVTLNSGTYKCLNTGAYSYGSVNTGDINFVINEGVTVTDGVITIGGGMQSKTSAMVDTGVKCGGNYKVVINGGTFTNTNIHVGVVASGSGGFRFCSVEGDTTIDINGGTFAGCKIGTYETLGAGVASGDLASDANGVDFKKGITVDLIDIPNASKATYKAMIQTADIAETLTKNKLTVVEHGKTTWIDIDDETHKFGCPCGCGLEDAPVAHEYDAGVVTKQPSHSQIGEKTYTCSKCGGTKLEDIYPDASTHNYTTGWVKNDADTHKKTCDDPACADATKGLVTAPHNWNGGVVQTQATHMEEGVKLFTCTDCGETKTEAIAKVTDHKAGSEWVKHDADKHALVCECGEVMKLGDHDWNEGYITTQPTVDAEGEKTYTCKDCGEKKTEAVAKLTAPETEAAGSGCGSVVGMGIATVALVSTAVVCLPKKKEN